MCRIANALLALRNAGNARYITWSYSFYCEFDVYDVLNNQAIKMEKELKKWSDEIVKSRNNFRVLNLFTTQQLRVIRQHLGQLKCDSIHSLPTTVISMLMSISISICEKDIKDCLQSVKSKDFLPERHSSKDLERSAKLSNPVDGDSNGHVSQFNPENEVSIEATIEKQVMELISQLNDVERNAYEELKENYQDEVAYLSIKNCSSPTMTKSRLVVEANEWCLENENLYVGKDPIELLNELQSMNVHDNHNEQNTNHENDTNPVAQSEDEKIYLTEQILIEDNDIPSGLAREAAKIYCDNIVEALDYCLDEQNKSTDESFLQLPITGRSR